MCAAVPCRRGRPSRICDRYGRSEQEEHAGYDAWGTRIGVKFRATVSEICGDAMCLEHEDARIDTRD